MMAVRDIRDRLAAGQGPVDACDFLVERTGPVIANLDDDIDASEDKAIADAPEDKVIADAPEDKAIADRHIGLRTKLWQL